jgi:putative membrane protein
MSANAEKPDNTQLALDRTWLAHERTLMAWVRTATSMIGFAFTIYKFFQFEAGRGAPATRGLITPREFAMILVGIALVALVAATVGHRRETRLLAVQAGKRRSLAELVAALIGFFGIAVFISAWFHG